MVCVFQKHALMRAEPGLFAPKPKRIFVRIKRQCERELAGPGPMPRSSWDFCCPWHSTLFLASQVNN